LKISSEQYPKVFSISTKYVEPTKNKINEIKTDYGCLMMKVNFNSWDNFITQYIDKDDIYNDATGDYGYETEPHVTILYGFHDNTDLDKIKEILSPIKNDIRMQTNKIGVFETAKYDVIKFDIHSLALNKLHNVMVNNFDYTSDFDKYLPHITIAYVKKGLGKKYVKTLKNTLTLFSDTFLYSYANGEKEEFSIKKDE